MAKFHPLKVIDVRKETHDCVSIAFDIPDSLKSEYQYIPGQYITIRTTFNGEEVRRSYSICSCPYNENEFRIAAKKVPAGKLSPFINDKLKTGDRIEVMTPMGGFHSELNPGQTKNYILFAGGSGITPVYSILKSILFVEPKSAIILFYANRDRNAVIFQDAIQCLAGMNKERFSFFNLFDLDENGDPLFTGMMTKEKVSRLLEKYVAASSSNEYFICGPLPMMNNIKEVLESMKISKHRVHIEYFTTALEKNITAETPPAPRLPNGGEPIDSRVKIILDFRETEISLSSNGKPILDAAMEAGLDVPYSCKGAVCCTCRAKLLEGKVYMDKNFALTDAEVEAGFILTCQSHPVTGRVVVDYNAVS